MTTVYNCNGNGGNGATTLISPTKTIAGRGLAHRHLDSRQRAVLAADVLDGTVQFDLSQTQLATLLGVSVPYIQAARKLSPSKRTGILHGWDLMSFAELVPTQRQLRMKLPMPMCASITNHQLQHVIRTVGVERALNAAVEVELNT
jgi:hypothetical protein